MSDDLHDDLNDRLASVVPIHPDRDLGDDDAPVQAADQSPCAHRKVKLDQDAHRVICRECDQEVDPFAFLLRLASDWERYARHRREAERRANAAHARLDEILRLERNARSRLKRIDPDARPPAVPWGHRSVGW